MYIGKARNKLEINEAISLAANNFQIGKLAKDGEVIKKALMQAGRTIKRKDVIVISNCASRVLACCFLVDRIFRIRGTECKGTFLTSITVKDDCRGQGISRLLMEKAVEECNSRLSTIAILIARKSVDFFYNKFEFWGVSSYSKISMKSSEISSQKKIKNREMTLADVPKINYLYKKTYSKLLGSVKRFKDDWSFIEWKVGLLKAKFIIFENYNNDVIGYAILKENKIYEISVQSKYKYMDLLYSLGLKSSYEVVFFYVGSDHPLVKQFEGIDFSSTQRNCSYGGHMVRVLDKQLLTSLMSKDIKNKLESSQIYNYQYSDVGVDIQMKNGELKLALSSSNNNYFNTCFLLGADTIGLALSTKYLLSLQQFNVLEIDQV
jgi:N-acetylglutamate synthase-like GNAT family acetyltransferase